LVQNYPEVKGDLLGHLFSGSGLVWYGGAIGGALAVLGWAHWRGFLNLTLLDVAAPALALGYAIGRIGCQMSGDGDYGKPWNGPWATACGPAASSRSTSSTPERSASWSSSCAETRAIRWDLPPRSWSLC
jgi:prolipoprotein diacylglyceryltransferase